MRVFTQKTLENGGKFKIIMVSMETRRLMKSTNEVSFMDVERLVNIFNPQPYLLVKVYRSIFHGAIFVMSLMKKLTDV